MQHLWPPSLEHQASGRPSLPDYAKFGGVAVGNYPQMNNGVQITYGWGGMKYVRTCMHYIAIHLMAPGKSHYIGYKSR